MRAMYMATLGLLLGACNQFTADSEPEVIRQVNIPFTPDVSINEVMVAQIDHAARFIWAAANPDLPAADIDWQEVEHHAIQIVSSRSTLSMGGSGVNDAMWIVQPSWRDYVNQLNNGGLLAIRSARDNDVQGLVQASEMLVQTCEGCHQQFKPSIPTEGYYRLR